MSPTRREFLHRAAAAGVALSSPRWLAGCAPAAPLPNVVLIFTDDQGYGDVGVYGARGFATPNLDGLAERGMRFTDFYASEGVCSASRASLLTGCYAPRVSILGALSPGAQVGLNGEETTLAEMLKSVGYATAMVGKWHLGHGPEFLPLSHGFDEYFGLPYSNDMWPVDYDGVAVPPSDRRYPPLPLIDGEEVVDTVDELADQDRLTTRYTERAVDFIDRSAGGPFFLYLAHSMPHVPLGVSDRFRGSSAQGMYGDVIQEIDWSVGRVQEALQRNGIDERTLVIFTSDNGPWLNYGDHAGTTGPLREGKGTAFEGGPRVPAIVRWPGHTPPGSVCSRMASTIDVLPTLAEITGAALPPRPIDGVSLVPLLEGDPEAEPRRTFWFYYTGELRAVREGRFKRVFEHRTRSYEGVEPGTGGHPGPYAFPVVPPALYDLEADVGETTDVSATYPEVVARLETLAEEARSVLGDRLTGRTGAEVRPPGRRDLGRPDRLEHEGVGATVVRVTPTDPRYPGAGPETLVDGILGSGDFRDGRWAAYDGVDMEAELDLGEPRTVERVGVDCLQVQAAWILLPRRVSVEVSVDGAGWRALPPIDVPAAPDSEVTPRLLSVEVGGPAVRFLRVRAHNSEPLPDWHPGAGNTGWIFVDEIVVEGG